MIDCTWRRILGQSRSKLRLPPKYVKMVADPWQGIRSSRFGTRRPGRDFLLKEETRRGRLFLLDEM